MAKKSPLSVDEWKLLSWRAGMKLGSAIDHHRHAHWYLKQKESASGKKSSTPDINLPFALASEVSMAQDFAACVGLCESFGFKLAPLEGCEECGKLVRRGPRLTAEDEEWTREFVKAVDARLDAGYEAIRNHLREQGEEIAAFFDLAVRASIWITSPSDPANLSRLAYVAGVTDECMSPFLKALGPETERDAFRQQLAHFDQCVERNLLYGASKSPSGDDR
jgi:hypothetical protein